MYIEVQPARQQWCSRRACGQSSGSSSFFGKALSGRWNTRWNDHILLPICACHAPVTPANLWFSLGGTLARQKLTRPLVPRLTVYDRLFNGPGPTEVVVVFFYPQPRKTPGDIQPLLKFRLGTIFWHGDIVITLDGNCDTANSPLEGETNGGIEAITFAWQAARVANTPNFLSSSYGCWSYFWKWTAVMHNHISRYNFARLIHLRSHHEGSNSNIIRKMTRKIQYAHRIPQRHFFSPCFWQ